MTDFGADYIRQVITDNPEPYVKDQMKYEFLTTDNSGIVYAPDQLDEMIDKRYEKLEPEERSRLMEEIIQFKLKLFMEQMIEANYQRIKAEMEDLVNRAWANDGTEPKDGGADNSNDQYDPMKDPIMVDPWYES